MTVNNLIARLRCFIGRHKLVAFGNMPRTGWYCEHCKRFIRNEVINDIK